MLLSPLGLFHEFFLFNFTFSTEPYGSLPNGNNHGQPRRPASLRPFPQASVLSFMKAPLLTANRTLVQTSHHNNASINNRPLSMHQARKLDMVYVCLMTW
jgi:hypothetical protein